ncbi:hypothetical protein [Nonomuraea sp. NPDC050643]|uniref:hypothetical protein n=1 Tax=Nonomuraea sp. NPDC050643 TaxID=3155660 RepID=UPI00340B4D65
MTIEHIMFRSGDVRCAADLHLPPEADGPVPGVVMGHSVHMVKEALAPGAAYLVRAGFAVLAVDYRTIGAAGRGAARRARRRISAEPGRAVVAAPHADLTGTSLQGRAAGNP